MVEAVSPTILPLTKTLHDTTSPNTGGAILNAVVLGDPKIGKTSLIESFINDQPCQVAPVLLGNSSSSSNSALRPPRIMRTKTLQMPDSTRIKLQIADLQIQSLQQKQKQIGSFDRGS